MILVEFIVVLIASILGIIAGLQMLLHPRAPLPEQKIFGLGIFLFGLSISFYLPVSIYSNFSNELIRITDFRLQFYGFGLMTAYCGVYILYLSITLPEIKLGHIGILRMSLISSLFLLTAVLLYDGVIIHLIGNRILISFDPLAFVFLNLSLIIFLSTFIIKLKKVLDLRNQIVFYNVKIFILIIILSTIASFSTIIPALYPESIIPTFFNSIFSGILFIVLASSFRKDEAFFFSLPFSLDGIIISHNDSGLRLYSKMYSPSLPIEDLIVGLIDGVNSSLKSNLAISSINNISFIDKQIFISYGKVINVLMITSNINIITRRLAKYLCDQFEKEFGIDLVGIDDFGIVETSVYNRFDVELAYVNSYFLG